MRVASFIVSSPGKRVGSCWACLSRIASGASAPSQKLVWLVSSGPKERMIESQQPTIIGRGDATSSSPPADYKLDRNERFRALPASRTTYIVSLKKTAARSQDNELFRDNGLSRDNQVRRQTGK